MRGHASRTRIAPSGREDIAVAEIEPNSDGRSAPAARASPPNSSHAFGSPENSGVIARACGAVLVRSVPQPERSSPVHAGGGALALTRRRRGRLGPRRCARRRCWSLMPLGWLRSCSRDRTPKTSAGPRAGSHQASPHLVDARFSASSGARTCVSTRRHRSAARAGGPQQLARLAGRTSPTASARLGGSRRAQRAGGTLRCASPATK